MIAFIARKNSAVLWSFGNYQYEIEWSDGRKQKFEAEYEEALKKFNEVV